MPRTKTSFADFSINPSAAHRFRRVGKKPPTLPELDPTIDPLERQVRQAIADELAKDFAEVTPEKALIRDLGADSLDVVEIVMSIEEQLVLSVDDDDIETLVRVSDVIAYVRRSRR